MNTTAAAPIVETIPAELAREPRWVVWKSVTKPGSAKPTKVPYNACAVQNEAESDNPQTWATFDEARTAFEKNEGFAGIGFMLGDGWAGIDLDLCIDATTGDIDPEALNIVEHFDTYAEISPSGSGIKLFLRGSLPCDRGRRFNGAWASKVGRIELYDHGRFFAVTGNLWHGAPATVEDRDAKLKDLFKRLEASRQAARSRRSAATNGNGQPHRPDEIPMHVRAERCRKYVEKCPDAISGQGGHDKTIHAACECVRFDLDVSARWELMRWFNDHKTGGERWTDHELAHKIEDAERIAGSERGLRLREQSDPRPRASSNGNGAVAPSTAINENAAIATLNTDIGNAARFVIQHGKDIRYCHQRGAWLVWTSKRWEWDETGRAVALAKQTALSIFTQATREPDADRRERLAKWAIASQKRERISALLALAQPDLAISPAQLDADPFLLNCRNGVLDLRTGNRRSHRREDFITRMAEADYRPDAAAPSFARFLARIFRTHPTLIDYIHRAIGYAATGDVREQCLFFMNGPGANGKTTLLDAIQYVLADYAAKADPNLLMMRDGSPPHPTNVADLMGRRLVVCSETADGRRFDESRLKDLAGETRLKARFLYGDFFEFASSHKVFLYSNHRPLVRGTDYGFWRRMRLIPFVETIGDGEKDTDLPRKLRAEADGILAWIVTGAVRWYRDGLTPPPEVSTATAEYRAEMDSVGAFLADCCVEGNDLQVYAADIYAAYVHWIDAAGEKPLSQKRLGTTLTERGYVSDRCSYSNRRIWRRIGLRAENPNDPASMVRNDVNP